jgi:hypothetical protein
MSGTTTPTDEAWKPTREAVHRALEAGVTHLSVPVRGAACSHNNRSLHECPECRKAILDYERQQGREPTDPEAWKTDRAKEIDEERVKAHKAFTAALGPQGKGWHVWLSTSISVGLVWGLADYVSLGAGIAMAMFVITSTMHYLANIEGARRLTVREAQRDADEWDHIHTQFLRAP